MSRVARPTGRALAAGGALAVSALLGAALLWLERPAAGPVEPRWGSEDCAHCHMLLGDPAYAAQAHLADGTVLFFDDPGCLLAWTGAPPAGAVVRRSWFHHSREPRWLAADETAFVPARATPMDWGLAAVAAGEPGSIGAEEARRGLGPKLAQRGAG